MPDRGTIHRSLKASMWDGVSASGMIGIVDTALAAFGIALKGSASQIAQLASLPNLVAALSQSQASSLADWIGTRRKTLLTLIMVQLVSLVGMAGLGLLPTHTRVSTLIGLAIFYVTCGSLAGPVWGSLICEYLPFHKRSGYFGWRSRILGVVAIAASLLAGWLLEYFGKMNVKGFVILFLVAAVLRLISWDNTRKMFEPMHRWAFRERRRWLRFDKGGERNFYRFLIFGSVMMVMVQLSGPLQSFYLLRDLQVSYISYTFIIAASNTTMFFMMGVWGKHANISGNLKVIRLTARMLPLLSLLWIFSTSPIYLIIVQALSGLAWAGYNLCITNFIYDCVPASERVRATAIYNMANSGALFLGALISGQLFDIVPPLFGHSYLTLCVLSTVGRAFAVGFLLRGVTEVRHVRQVRSMDLFNSVIGLKPLPGIPRETLRLIFQNKA